MLPQDAHQPGPPGRVTVWGRPWHGLVEGGTLTLPNGATMAHPYPGDAGDADVLAFRPPGTPAVARTPEQAAADAAAGRQWLDYALISGRAPRLLYGQSLGGAGTWLYAAPDGSRWLVRLQGATSQRNLTVPWSVSVTVERFGEIGAPAESHTLSDTLADWQQTLPGNPAGLYHVAPHGAVTSAYCTVQDVRPDGSQAVLAVEIDDQPSQQDYRGWPHRLPRVALGFVTLSLSGTPGVDAALAAAVVRSRAQTLGTPAGSITDGRVQYYFDPIDGSWSTTDTNPGIVDYQVVAGAYSRSNSVTDRILAMCYTPGESLEAVTLSAADAQTSNVTVPTGGTSSFSWTATEAFSASVTLAGPAGSVTLSMSGGASIAYGVSGGNELVVNSISDYTIGPDSWSESGSLTKTLSNSAADRTLPDGGMASPQPSSSAYHVTPDMLPLASRGAAPDIIEYVFGITRYSATAYELVLATVRVTDDTYQSYRYLGAVTPTVAVATIIATTAEAPYGSAHPVTGDLARARAAPVCWV